MYIYQGVNVDDVRGREPYWQHKLDKFEPKGLNELHIALRKLHNNYTKLVGQTYSCLTFLVYLLANLINFVM